MADTASKPLPKRTPRNRPAMAKPEPEPRPVPSWEQLTAPLDTSAPVILPPAVRCEWDQLADELRAGRKTDQDLLNEWEAAACHATYRPCTDRTLAAAASPHRLPSERLFPAMMP